MVWILGHNHFLVEGLLVKNVGDILYKDGLGHRLKHILQLHSLFLPSVSMYYVSFLVTSENKTDDLEKW